jgi:hypothetical protein
MSHLDEFETTMTDKEALLRALVRMGFTREHIEVNAKGRLINGYHATEDNKMGHIIINKQHSKIPSEIGWEEKDGCYVSHVDAYNYSNFNDYRGCPVYDHAWQMKLLEYYNLEKDKMTLSARGITCTETRDSKGRLQLIAKMGKAKTNQMKIRM